MAAADRQEDVVEYFLYPAPGKTAPGRGDENSCLEEQADKILAHLSPLLVDYIWQKEPFNLRVVAAKGDHPPHLHGRTHFGDNIEDEWFIVHLLLQITTSFPDYIARVQDNDGEFLLIEAAEHIPRWLTPDTSHNRVFLFHGQLHIIPQPRSPAEIACVPAGTPSLRQALDIVSRYPGLTVAGRPTQDIIIRRIGSYPEKMHALFHHAHCYLPPGVVAVLNHSPALVAPAVQAFYERDPLDMKACRAMKHFPTDSCVRARVRFTRCLYGQLLQQRFTPDKRSGWTVPPPSHPDHPAWDLGIKLACGFEILCCRSPGSPSVTDDSSQVSDVRWQRYLSFLTEKGYFKSELEGSKRYKELLQSAHRHYQETATVSCDRSCPPSVDHGQEVLNILRTSTWDLKQLQAAGKHLEPPDDDSWLAMTPGDLDAMLEEQYGGFYRKSGDLGEASSTLGNMVDSMKAFVDNVSSHDGAEFPRMDEDQPVDFDVDSFSQAMERILGLTNGRIDEDDEDEDDGLMESESDSSEESEDEGEYEIGADGSTEDTAMTDYMDQMDQELARTNVGKSFEKEPSQVKTAAPKDLPMGAANSNKQEGDIEDEDDVTPVNVDLNLVKNLLESYSSQQGLAGPATNILGTMGVKPPEDADELD
ncbi:protein ecdysoneless homolog [Branchiostoma floridae]|uniref:Protein ecdysoneless homolog n=1 Tax=Branchiostoma floridae TaxID=7739 RepID=A0A9J7N9S1_BRAFL|nr:protein ecdysoneless homolog [Branchiostoma floridae]